MLMDAYVGGGGCIENAYVSILKAVLKNQNLHMFYENVLGFHYFTVACRKTGLFGKLLCK